MNNYKISKEDFAIIVNQEDPSDLITAYNATAA